MNELLNQAIENNNELKAVIKLIQVVRKNQEETLRKLLALRMNIIEGEKNKHYEP